MLPSREERCKECDGFGIEWNDVFDRAVDTVMDTQGLSYYDAVNQVKNNRSYEEDYKDCKDCKGTGKNK